MFELTPFDRKRNALHDPWKDFWNFGNDFFGNGMPARFKTDIKDMGDKFLLEAELPGFDKNDIKIDINADTLTIHAERNAKTEEKSDDGSYVRRERSYGSLSRSFDISGVNADEITADYTDGVLALSLPKQEAKLPPSRSIEIG